MAENTTSAGSKDADGIVILTLDDPDQSANTMNEAYTTSMARDRRPPRGREGRDHRRRHHLARRRPSSPAATSRHDRRPSPERRRRGRSTMVEAIKARAAPAGDARQAGRRRDQRRRARRRPRDRAGLSPPHRRRRPRVVRSACPRCTLGLLPGGGGVTRTVRMLGIQNALHAACCCRASGSSRPRPRRSASSTRSSPRVDELVPAAKAWIKANPEGARAAVGRQGLQDPRRHPVEPGARREPAGVPGEPAQAAQGRADYPAPRAHPGRRRRGRAGRLRHRVRASRAATSPTLVTGQVAKNMIQAFFFDLQADQRRRARARGHRASARPRRSACSAPGMMGAGIAYVSREGRHRGRAQGRLARGRREGQGLLARRSRPRRSRAARPPQEKADALLARITPTADPADLAGRRPRDRGRLRGPGAQAQGVRTRSSRHRRARRAARLQHLDAADHRARRGRRRARRTSSACTSSRPVDKMPLVEIIKGEKTSDEALARVLDFALADPQDPDRRQRQPRLLHQPRDRHVRQRGRRRCSARASTRGIDRAGRARRPATRRRRCS